MGATYENQELQAAVQTGGTLRILLYGGIAAVIGAVIGAVIAPKSKLLYGMVGFFIAGTAGALAGKYIFIKHKTE